MKVRDTLGTLLDVSRVETHELSIPQQLRKKGEATKVIAAARCLPPKFLECISANVSSNTFPVHGDETIKPVAFGCEAIVYSISSPAHGQERRLKLFRKFDRAEEIAKTRRAHTQILRQCLGDLVVPQHYAVCESPYGTGAKAAIALQDRVEGKDFFDEPSRANSDDVSQLWEGIREMRERFGLLADVGGRRNLLVTDNGDIRVVDNGVLEADNLIPRVQATVDENLAVISHHVSSDIALAS